MTKRRLLQLLQPFLLLIAFIFIVLLLQQQWTELQSYEWRLHPGWLLLSGLLMVGSWFIEVATWRYGLARVGGFVDYATAVRIWFASILVRYIPGNVWQPLGMTVLARQAGVRPEATVMSVALYQAVNLLSVIPIAGVYLLWWRDQSPLLTMFGNVAPWLALLALLPIGVFLARPVWLIDLLNLVLARLGRPILPATLDSGQLLWLFALAIWHWLLWGSAFAALTFALQPFTPVEMLMLLPHHLVAYPLAYAVGYLSFITPGGLAVREGALILLLAPFLGSVATVSALLMRLWQIVLEVVVAGLVAMLAARRHPTAQTGVEIGKGR
jgi:glycosyltransferase 2 family protein